MEIYKFACWTCIVSNYYKFICQICMLRIQWSNWGDVTIRIHFSPPHLKEESGDEVPDDEENNDFLPSDNNVFTFASEGEHVLSLSSLLAPNYHPQLERLSKFRLCFLYWYYLSLCWSFMSYSFRFHLDCLVRCVQW